MALVLYSLMYIPAVLGGAGYIANPWVIVSVISAWIWSIWRNSEKGDVDYKQLESQSFISHDKSIRNATLMRLATIACVYGIAYLFR
ncbi:hypothetical protein GCM10011491_41430 [Brucella endophytica]|uniref:Uncharacterized protein n=1 Tax=Brucella endophytica TaxID=1963359 RepID=A0A916WKP9_9HYPH|nr:hypothetical protein GCM10011491_41430 [Brucella endophytica]